MMSELIEVTFQDKESKPTWDDDIDIDDIIVQDDEELEGEEAYPSSGVVEGSRKSKSKRHQKNDKKNNRKAKQGSPDSEDELVRHYHCRI
jgi:hypothetical protein